MIEKLQGIFSKDVSEKDKERNFLLCLSLHDNGFTYVNRFIKPSMDPYVGTQAKGHFITNIYAKLIIYLTTRSSSVYLYSCLLLKPVRCP